MGGARAATPPSNLVNVLIMELEYFFVLLLILLVQRVAAQSWNDSAFPSFPTIFSFYREDIVNYGELPATARLSRVSLTKLARGYQPKVLG